MFFQRRAVSFGTVLLFLLAHFAGLAADMAMKSEAA